MMNLLEWIFVALPALQQQQQILAYVDYHVAYLDSLLYSEISSLEAGQNKISVRFS